MLVAHTLIYSNKLLPDGGDLHVMSSLATAFHMSDTDCITYSL